jgi:hypothetical protein
LIARLSGWTVEACEYPGPKVTVWTSSPPPKWRSEAVCTSLIAGWSDDV